MEGENRRRVGQRMEHRAREHLRYGVRSVLQRCRHAEVAAATAQPPEEVGVLVFIGGERLAAGGSRRRPTGGCRW